MVGPWIYRAATYLWADGAGPIGRPPSPFRGSAPCLLSRRFGPPLRGALLQHQPPGAQSCPRHGHQLCPLTTACPLISGALPPSPLTVSGGQPTAYRALPGGRYPRAVCTAPTGHGSAPGGLAEQRQNPMLMVAAWGSGARGLCITGRGLTGHPWVYRDHSLCGRQSARRYHRQGYIIITVRLCQPPFFDCPRGPA